MLGDNEQEKKKIGLGSLHLFWSWNIYLFCLGYCPNMLGDCTDELVAEKEKYKDIGDDLDTAFVELILKE